VSIVSRLTDGFARERLSIDCIVEGNASLK
jgi:hypothetical protein